MCVFIYDLYKVALAGLKNSCEKLRQFSLEIRNYFVELKKPPEFRGIFRNKNMDHSGNFLDGKMFFVFAKNL